MEQVRDENPAVVNCYTRWFSPDQPNRVLFRIRGNKICTYFSDGTMSVEIVVESTAESAGQQQALCVALNEWYESTY